MANKDNKTFLPRPPFHRPISNKDRNNLVSTDWNHWFDLLRLRVGGTYANSSKDLEDSNISNAENLQDLKNSVEVIDKNVNKISTTMTEVEEKVRKLINETDIDHETIVTAAKKIEALELDVNNIKEEQNNIKEEIQNARKIEVVASLPSISDEKYDNTIVDFNNELYYKIKGGACVKIAFSV